MHPQTKREIQYLLWRLQFADSVWKCQLTGNELTIPADFSRGQFFSFGKDASFIDVGDIYYSRFGGNPVLVSSPYENIVNMLQDELDKLEGKHENN